MATCVGVVLLSRGSINDRHHQKQETVERIVDMDVKMTVDTREASAIVCRSQPILTTSRKIDSILLNQPAGLKQWTQKIER